MRGIKMSLQLQAFLWDFSKDGGAISIYDSKIVIPPGGLFILAVAQILELTSTGNPVNDFTIGVGYTAAPNSLMSFNSVAGDLPIGLGSVSNPFSLAINETIKFSIQTNAVIAGKMTISFVYSFSNPN